MKWFKIAALLLLTLAVMRAGSWGIGWSLAKLLQGRRRTVAIAANILAFTAFLMFLYFNLLPGEPMDIAAVLFGFVVFAIYTVSDFYWRPWERRARTGG